MVRHSTIRKRMRAKLRAASFKSLYQKRPPLGPPLVLRVVVAQPSPQPVQPKAATSASRRRKIRLAKLITSSVPKLWISLQLATAS
jgi:hypothetical protein